MLTDLHIAIVVPNCIMRLGLIKILEELFNCKAHMEFSNLDALLAESSLSKFQYIILHEQQYPIYNEILKPLKDKLILINDNNYSSTNILTSPCLIRIGDSAKELKINLEKYFALRTNNITSKEAEKLSGREVEVLRYIALGYANKDIAQVLELSTHTVISHRKNLIKKLGIASVSGLTNYALNCGYITSNEIDTNHN